MKDSEIDSVADVENMSYSDFVGFINQWNSPPGSYSTINKLAIFSRLNRNSELLEIGCSTGFSSRELCGLTNCRGLGIDISEKSIAMAKYNKIKYSPKSRLRYSQTDGHEFHPKNKFSHIMIGGNLKFFNNPEIMMSRCIDYLQDGGFILATPYYEIKKLPSKEAKKVGHELGIPMEAFKKFSYKEVMTMFNKLEIIYEEKMSLMQETDEEIDYHVKSVISQACQINLITDKKVEEAMRCRLTKIRKMINLTRDYQEYVVLVLRYRQNIFPNRYTALY